MIKQEYIKKLNEIKENNPDVNKTELKKIIKNENNNIIYEMNESKQYNPSEIVDLLTYSLIWIDEYIETIKNEPKNKEDFRNEIQKEIENKKRKNNIDIIVLIYALFIAIILIIFIKNI